MDGAVRCGIPSLSNCMAGERGVGGRSMDSLSLSLLRQTLLTTSQFRIHLFNQVKSKGSLQVVFHGIIVTTP